MAWPRDGALYAKSGLFTCTVSHALQTESQTPVKMDGSAQCSQDERIRDVGQPVLGRRVQSKSMGASISGSCRYTFQLAVTIHTFATSQSTYYDRRYRQGPALIRARRPYLFKNAATGLGLMAIVSGIYWYTLRAVGQDDFDDVKVPDVPQKHSN
ncbi:hypothetical protein E4U41_004502 [Claviceps citrina]|nr:hypothetical protein E4U41_004502 [Claviceps citrina]